MRTVKCTLFLHVFSCGDRSLFAGLPTKQPQHTASLKSKTQLPLPCTTPSPPAPPRLRLGS
uniref:Uncharacterized protein n=1 Tax=Lates calcarifer TaxID=8187 RepID=A0A4W6EK47_LATCA